jgi:hypothetical protein
MTKYTAEEISRIHQALTETHNALARAMRYREDLRDADLIDFYNQHIAKLEAMLLA